MKTCRQVYVLDWTRWRFQTYFNSQAAGADVRKLVQLAHLRVMICGWKYHLNYIIPQCQRVNTTPRLSRLLDEADSQVSFWSFWVHNSMKYFTCFLWKENWLLGRKILERYSLLITRQIGLASTTEPIGQPLVVSNIKPERYQDLIRNLFSRARCRQQGISTFEFPFNVDLFCILFYWKFNPQRWTGEWISICSERKKRVE